MTADELKLFASGSITSVSRASKRPVIELHRYRVKDGNNGRCVFYTGELIDSAENEHTAGSGKAMRSEGIGVFSMIHSWHKTQSLCHS